MQRQSNSPCWTKIRHGFRLLIATLAFAGGLNLMPSAVLATDATAQPTTEQVSPTAEATQPAVPSGGTVYDDHPNLQNVLGIASQFHIFARSAELQTHTAGNLAVETLDGHVDFGTTNKLELLDRDITYLQTIRNIRESSFVSAGDTRCNKVIFGENVTIDLSNLNRPLINNTYIDHLVAAEVYQDQPGQVYLDFNAEFATLTQLNQTLSQTPPQAQFSAADFKDENQREIDVSKLGSLNGQLVINLTPEVLSVDRPLTIKGLSDTADGVTVIFNVATGGPDYTVNSPIKIIYPDGSQRHNKDADDYGDNHLLWNFHHQHQPLTGTVNVNAPFQGSVLLPHAALIANQNMDGNLIANSILINAESHRWDLQDHNNETKEPEEVEEEEEDLVVPDKEDPGEEEKPTAPDVENPDEGSETTTPDEDLDGAGEPDTPNKEGADGGTETATPDEDGNRTEETTDPAEDQNDRTPAKESANSGGTKQTTPKRSEQASKKVTQTLTDHAPTLTSTGDSVPVETLNTHLTQSLAYPANTRRGAVNQTLTTLDRHINQAADDPVRANHLTYLRSRGLAATQMDRLPKTDERTSSTLALIGLGLAVLTFGIGWYLLKRQKT